MLNSITLYAKWEDIKTSADVLSVTSVNRTYTVYYGDTITLQAPKNSVQSLNEKLTKYAWTISANGTTYFSKTISGNRQCSIDTKVLPVNTPCEITLETGPQSGDTFMNTYNSTTINVIYKQGDIDGDGDVDSADAAKLLKHISGTAVITDNDVLKRADMDCNGEVDMRDVILILRKSETA